MGQTVPGSADNVTIDASSGAGTITVNTNVNVVSITCGAMDMTLDFSANNNTVTLGLSGFSCTGRGNRTFNPGSGTWTFNATTATFINFTAVTNLSPVTGWNVVVAGTTAGRRSMLRTLCGFRAR